MEKYPKIQTIYKRDMENKGRIMQAEWSCPEFQYLRDNVWIFTEKVDGTNIRVKWTRGVGRIFGGRPDNAQIPAFLIEKLEELFFLQKLDNAITKADKLCLYGEGYGAKIQKGGGKYISDGVDFVLFDVLVDDWWLSRIDVEDVAAKLNLKIIPVIGAGTLDQAAQKAKEGFTSYWGDFIAEGIVMKPEVELQTRAGNRIISKIKHKDFIE